jgi:hypothetical protein
MALDNVYYPHALKLPTPDITHFTDITPDRGQQVVMETQAGSTTPCFVGVGSVNPTVGFTSRSLKPIMDTIDIEYIVKDLSSDTVDLWYRAGKPMEIREDDASPVHKVGRLQNSAMLFWSQLTVSTGNIAEIQASIVTAKRQAADTMVWLGDQTLPSRSGCQNVYGLGPVYLDNVKLEGVTGWTLSSNVSLEPVSADGVPSNVYNGIRSYHVQCTLDTNQADLLDTTSLGGDSYIKLSLYLQKMVSTNTFDDAESPTHIRIDLKGGLQTVAGPTGSPVAVAPVFYTYEHPTESFDWDTATTIPD